MRGHPHFGAPGPALSAVLLPSELGQDGGSEPTVRLGCKAGRACQTETYLKPRRYTPIAVRLPACPLAELEDLTLLRTPSRLVLVPIGTSQDCIMGSKRCAVKSIKLAFLDESGEIVLCGFSVACAKDDAARRI